MGNRETNKLPDYAFTWLTAHSGRYWKRLLSKKRRKTWKDERHQRGLAGLESTVNYKNW